VLDVSNLEYEEALKNEDNIKIINSVCRKYLKRIDTEDLHRCKLMALWDAIKKYNPDRGVKFTSFLYSCVTWECKRQVHHNMKTKPGQMCAEKEDRPQKGSEVKDLINSLPNKFSKVVSQRFMYGYTIKEIARENNYSRETARQNVKKAVKALRKKCD
tara:strand:- start:2044 stop:2517 length:474 start_codon:yes stop_codon:yes gene_type:complete